MNDRIEKVRNNLKKWGVEAVIIEDPLDLFYLTHLNLSAGTLFISKSQCLLFVSDLYREYATANSSFPVENLLNATNLEVITNSSKNKSMKVGINAQTTTLFRAHFLKNLFGNLIELDNPVGGLRVIKDQNEINLIKKAQSLNEKGYRFVLSILKKGITEKEVAQRLNLFWIDNGGEKLAFESIIAFGENSARPHHHPSNRKLKEGDIVLIDIGIVLNHYHSDMTRVVFFGDVHPKLKEIYSIVLKAQKKAIEACRPGISLEFIDKVARKYIADQGYEKCFTHSLGHGIGLKTHELPFFRKNNPKDKLIVKAGMVLTIEPGIYLPGLGGVRIEDILYITSNGYKLLNKSSKQLLKISI